MTLNELIAEVYELTNRPDLSALTLTTIKAATLKAHKSDFYSKDLYEVCVPFDSSCFTQCIDYIDLISNFRSFKYLRKADKTTDNVGVFFDIITPEEVLDSYGYSRADVAYLAGRILQIRSSTLFNYSLLGCYVLPIVTTAGYTSWVAEQFPFAIIYEACRVIFKSIGYDQQSSTFTGLVAEEYELLKLSALSDVGY